MRITKGPLPITNAILTGVWMALLIVTTLAQTAAPVQSPPTTNGQQDRIVAGAKPAASPSDSKVKRWLNIDALSVATRYRYIDARSGRVLINQEQWQFVAKGRFKFDRQGKYSVYGGLATGNVFTGGWNSTGIGTGSPQSNLFLKQLYFDAKPKKWLEFQVGGLAINNGENTEITSYDNDGYITGGRVQFRRPKDAFFDEVSITFAHIGEIDRPGFFRRIKHIDNINYHQVLVRKQLNKRISFSADYTFEMGRDFLHEAVKVKAKETHLLDSLLIESYQRVDDHRGAGFNISGEKTFFKKLNVNAGFAHIERPLLNSDRFPQGNRIYTIAIYKFNPEFSLGGGIIHGISGLPSPLSHRNRVEIIFNYSILDTLRRYKVL